MGPSPQGGFLVIRQQMMVAKDLEGAMLKE